MPKTQQEKTDTKQARALQEALAGFGIDLGYNRALEAIARMNGSKSLNASKANATQRPLAPRDSRPLEPHDQDGEPVEMPEGLRWIELANQGAIDRVDEALSTCRTDRSVGYRHVAGTMRFACLLDEAGRPHCLVRHDLIHLRIVGLSILAETPHGDCVADYLNSQRLAYFKDHAFDIEGTGEKPALRLTFDRMVEGRYVEIRR